MGLYISGSVGLPLPLYISTTVACFQALGSFPVESMVLKRWMRASLLWGVSHLKASAGMSSGPGALLFLTLAKMSESSFCETGCILTWQGGCMGVVGPVYGCEGGFQCCSAR